MIIKDLGAVSAYAYAVEKGYTGTEEEYAELMASYATVAEEAAESAESASQSATQAGASAQTATTKASEASQSATQASASATSASQSAQTATTKASEASASASTASTKASEASASASTASTKASEASASATSAQTAQGLAESARDDAVDAKADAESARDMAQQYAESIDPEKIYSAYPTDTASGSVVSFADGADDIPMKSVVVNIEPVQSGSGDPSPDNVRPISGWTGANVARTGKNLLDKSTLQVGVNWNGSAMAYAIASDYIAVKGGYTYMFSATNMPNHTGQTFVIFDSSKTFIGNVTTSFFTVPVNGAFIKFSIRCDSSHTWTQSELNDANVQLELGSTATEYEPYTGDTYSITFPSEAGTVYGGELDVTNGVLTVDRAFIASYNGETLPSEWISDRDKYVAGTTPTTGAQVCYELATPITYNLTPTEIKSLLGDNNIWADAGDTAVTYRADTKLYIDKKLGKDAPMIATGNVVSGSYFMVGSNLYKATANIANGAAVVVGTNAVAITMAEALNEINS